VFNKFGPAEAQGGGLAGEFLEALSEGFPVLTSVAERPLGHRACAADAHGKGVQHELTAPVDKLCGR
jgi:hypothetical protein